MNEPVDIIGGINSLDDVLSSTAGALNAVAGHVDDLRKAAETSGEADHLWQCIQQEVDCVLQWTAQLTNTPDDQRIRGMWAKGCNNLHTYGEDALILLSELEAAAEDNPSGSA